MKNLHVRLVATALVLIVTMMVASTMVLAKPVATAPSASSVAPADEPIADAEWTIMIYLDGDNSLESAAFTDLVEMEKIGSTAGVNVIVLMDTMDAIDGTHWYYLAPGSDHVLDDGTNMCDCEAIAGDHPGELNMGDGKNLTYFIKTAVAYAPAENYMLVLWDHGGGWWAICVDDSSFLPSGSADRLSMDETTAAVAASGVHLSIIGYDACFMGMVEVAYENRDIADYMIGSITTEPGLGWEYTMFLGAVAELPDKSAQEICRVAVETYDASYELLSSGAGISGFPYPALAAYDLEKVVDLVGVGAEDGGMYALANALLPLCDDYYLRGAIQSSEACTPQLQFMGEQFAFIDIGWFATLLGEKVPDLASITEKTFALLDAAVMYSEYVTADSGACMNTFGMSVYYTICYGHLYSSYAEVGLDFVSVTNWDEFLFALSMVYTP